MMDFAKMYKEGYFSKDELLDHFKTAIMIIPGIINRLVAYRDIYNDSYVERTYELNLPIQICDKKLFLSIIHSVFDETYDEERVLEQLRSAYNKFVLKL